MTHRLRVLALAFLTTACGGRITDPGPVDDSVLDDRLAHAAMVNGMARSLARALGYISLTGAAASREVVASGSTSTLLFGISLKQRQGILESGTAENNDHWQFAQQARWIAEDGARRMRETLGPDFAKSPLSAEALVFAGFANRLLGENMCEGVIDGGPRKSRQVYFGRAEDFFTEAITVAQAAGSSNIARAAQAGRASIRVWLGDWEGAASDAGAIPLDFRHQAKFSSTELEWYNRIHWSNANSPYRSHSVVGTFFDSYYTATNDPRTLWRRNTAIPFGSQGNVPWYFQAKYERREAPMNLVSGREMRLIVAESMLRKGDWQGATQVVNSVRGSVGVTPWTVTGLAEAWLALKRERSIELWLEARRLGDLHRWKEDGSPGAVEDMTGRQTCFPIGQNELDSNPNL